MRSILAFSLLLSMVLTSCLGRQQEANKNYYDQDYPNTKESYGENLSEFSDEPEISTGGVLKNLQRKAFKTHQFRDIRTGMVVRSSEYPSSWNVISKPSYTMDQKIPLFLMQIEGPNNLKTFNTPLQIHFQFSNPQMAQYLSPPLNQMLRPMVSNQQIHQNEVVQRMQNSGFTYVGQKAMPKVEAYLQTEIQKKGLGREQLEYLATEWKNDSGQRALASVVKIALSQPISQYDTMMLWFYSVDYAIVNESAFENTLEQLYQAAIKTKENPQWNQYVQQLRRQRQQQQAQQAAIAHRGRMNARWASFNAHQQKMKGIWAAQDANHASFMNRNFGPGSDVGQRQFVNMINEEETVYNPLTGKNYQVNAGSTEYWMDSDGNYIRNNDLFYTPNGDINLNSREWVKVKKAF